MFPLFDLRKSGTEEANSKSLLRIVALDSELITTFVHWLSAEASAKFAWLSGLEVFIFIIFLPIKIQKIRHLTKFLWQLFWCE
jgi:hypothetical protein